MISVVPCSKFMSSKGILSWQDVVKPLVGPGHEPASAGAPERWCGEKGFQKGKKERFNYQREGIVGEEKVEELITGFYHKGIRKWRGLEGKITKG